MRWWVGFALGLVTGLVGSAIAQERERAPVVRGSAFELVDESGSVRARLGFVNGNPELKYFGKADSEPSAREESGTGDAAPATPPAVPSFQPRGVIPADNSVDVSFDRVRGYTALRSQRHWVRGRSKLTSVTFWFVSEGTKVQAPSVVSMYFSRTGTDWDWLRVNEVVARIDGSERRRFEATRDGEVTSGGVRESVMVLLKLQDALRVATAQEVLVAVGTDELDLPTEVRESLLTLLHCIGASTSSAQEAAELKGPLLLTKTSGEGDGELPAVEIRRHLRVKWWNDSEAPFEIESTIPGGGTRRIASISQKGFSEEFIVGRGWYRMRVKAKGPWRVEIWDVPD